jgi:hypothetical protein
MLRKQNFLFITEDKKLLFNYKSSVELITSTSYGMLKPNRKSINHDATVFSSRRGFHCYKVSLH